MGEGAFWESPVTVKWPFVDILCWTTLLDLVSASPLPPVAFLLDSSFTIQAPSLSPRFQLDCFVCWPLLYSGYFQTIKGAVRGFSRTEKCTIITTAGTFLASRKLTAFPSMMATTWGQRKGTLHRIPSYTIHFLCSPLHSLLFPVSVATGILTLDAVVTKSQCLWKNNTFHFWGFAKPIHPRCLIWYPRLPTWKRGRCY